MGGGIKILEGNSVSLDGFRNAIGNIRGDIVVQQKAEQCPELNAIYRHSVNTMRIMSIIDKTGEVIILSRSLRMGTGGGRLDNAHSGGIFIGLDENGRLKEYALTLNGTKYYKHPDTGIIFKNVVLPSVSLVDEAVKKCAIRVPAFRIVAWDIIVDSKYEPTMIEANFFVRDLMFLS